MKILIVEDDATISKNLFDFLESRGYKADIAFDGVTGLHLAVSQHWDAILLDLSLPGMNGLALCRKLREDARLEIPVLMLTARDTLEDKLAGFEHGADDYLVKPFALREIEARLLALVKRHRGQTTQALLRCADIQLDARTMQVHRAERPIKLSPKCLRILQILMQSPNRVFGRIELESAVWGEQLLDSDTLRAHIYSLRRALTANAEPDPIETVHGLGYRIVQEDGR